MLKPIHKFTGMFAVVAIATGVAMSAAQAAESHDKKYGGENRGKPVQPAQTNAIWRQECAACHIAYAPGLLPAESWRRVMAGLDKHFDTDASLAAQENKEITDFLVSNASNRWSAPTAPLKITESAWFKRKHDDHEIAPSVWKNPLVKSPANCGACHTQADNGDFKERNIRMPK
jgi:hypothetical protein